MSPSSRRSGWKNHRRSSEPDRWLDELGFYRKHTPRDPSCLFRVISENVYNTQRFYNRVRMECVQFMASHRELFEMSLSCSFDNYLKEMANPGEWGGLTEIAAMSHLYGRNFIIFEASNCPQTEIFNGYDNMIFLFYISDSKHFDAVYTKDHVNSLSYCQSIVYETLYKGVFEMEGISYAIEKMLYDKDTDHVEYFMIENIERRKKQQEEASVSNETISLDTYPENKAKKENTCSHKSELIENDAIVDKSNAQISDVCTTCVNVKDAKSLLENGVTPFPYKVAKALDPEVYRNIEFDVWTEWKREMRYGSKYSDGTTLQVGAKCLCRLKADQKIPNRCHIQEMSPNCGPCLVFVEGIGEMRVVDYSQLEPLPLDEVRPWAPPYRQSRSFSQYLNITQILKQLGSESRKMSSNRLRVKIKQTQDDKCLDIDINGNCNSKVNWNDSFSYKQDPDSQSIHPVSLWDTNQDVLAPYNNYFVPDLGQYTKMDFFTFESCPIEISAMPLKVESRSENVNSVAAPQHPTNGQSSSCSTPANSVLENGTNNQGDVGGTGSMTPVLQNVTPAIVAGPVPALPPPPPMHPYAPAAYPAPHFSAGAVLPQMIYNPGMKMYPSIVIPPNVNPHQPKSMNLNGSDLPMNDIATLRFFFNLGIDCLWGGMCPMPPMPQPRIDINEITHEMQQNMTLNDRPIVGVANGVLPPPLLHAPPPIAPMHPVAAPTPPQVPNQPHGNANNKNQHKNNSQRPLVGPRFNNKRGNNDNNFGNNHNSKGYNNVASKGTNHRRNSVQNDTGNRGDENPEPVAHNYIAYPPAQAPQPIYAPLHYFPVEDHQGMMGYMGGYYVEEVDYGAYYPAPIAYAPGPPHPHLPPPPPHHGPPHHAPHHK